VLTLGDRRPRPGGPKGQNAVMLLVRKMLSVTQRDGEHLAAGTSAGSPAAEQMDDRQTDSPRV